MATFLLVHGAWHGAWCWAKLVPALARQGHRAVAFDLPGHGEDRTPVKDVTLEAYARKTAAMLDGLDEPAILVGHSMGGMVISAAAELRPERVRRLAYLCAGLLKDGETMLDALNADAGSRVGEAMAPAPDGLSSLLKPEAVREVFYGDCEQADVDEAIALVCPQPMAPVVVPLTLTPERFGRVARDYIVCKQDRAISVERQREMIAASPCARVVELDRSHSPFFSAPDELAGVLGSLAM